MEINFLVSGTWMMTGNGKYITFGSVFPYYFLEVLALLC